MKTTVNEKGGNLKSAGGLGAAPGPQAGSRGEAPVGDQGAKPLEKYGFSAITGPIFYWKLVANILYRKFTNLFINKLTFFSRI